MISTPSFLPSSFILPFFMRSRRVNSIIILVTPYQNHKMFLSWSSRKLSTKSPRRARLSGRGSLRHSPLPSPSLCRTSEFSRTSPVSLQERRRFSEALGLCEGRWVLRHIIRLTSRTTRVLKRPTQSQCRIAVFSGTLSVSVMDFWVMTTIHLLDAWGGILRNFVSFSFKTTAIGFSLLLSFREDWGISLTLYVSFQNRQGLER